MLVHIKVHKVHIKPYAASHAVFRPPELDLLEFSLRAGGFLLLRCLKECLRTPSCRDDTGATDRHPTNRIFAEL